VIKTPENQNRAGVFIQLNRSGQTSTLAIQARPFQFHQRCTRRWFGIYKSTNGGKNWNFIGNGSHSDFSCARPFNGQRRLASTRANDGGIFVNRRRRRELER